MRTTTAFAAPDKMSGFVVWTIPLPYVVGYLPYSVSTPFRQKPWRTWLGITILQASPSLTGFT